MRTPGSSRTPPTQPSSRSQSERRLALSRRNTVLASLRSVCADSGLAERSVDAHAVGVDGLTNGLEEGRSARGAVSGTTRGDAEGLGAVVERAAGVTRFGAHVGLDQTADPAGALVADGDVERLDGAGVDAGGGAVSSDPLTDVRIGDREAAGARERGVVLADQGVVVAREARGDRRADQGGLGRVGVPGRNFITAVTGGDEVVAAAALHVESQRAAVAGAVDRVTGAEQRRELSAGAVDRERVGVGTGGLGDLGELCLRDGGVGGDDDLLGSMSAGRSAGYATEENPTARRKSLPNRAKWSEPLRPIRAAPQ